MSEIKETYPELEFAKELANKGDFQEAWDICEKFLMRYPNHVPAMILGVSILDKGKRLVEAYHMARRACDLAPKVSATWTNRGRLAEELFQLEEAEAAYQQAIILSKGKEYPLTLNLSNMASFYCTTGQWLKCEDMATKALALTPGHNKALGNLGITQLAQGKWAEGWKNYASILGSDVRKLVRYRDEPEWQGEPGKDVIVTGEQGLGDELSFASMIPDAVAVAKKVIVDCDHRLENLFKRSFPKAKIYGSRWKKDIVVDDGDQHPDYSISIGQLGAIFRNKDEDFPGAPYLVADPDRVAMWKALWKTKRKPVIGIAWSGGLAYTGSTFRRWNLQQLQPIFNAVDAHWVCLQYKDASAEIKAFEGAEIHQYPYATLTPDYDDTAALVASCDLVIGMQTSVCHLAAALGVETWTYVCHLSQWRYGRDFVPWYKSMKLFRYKDDWPINEAANILKLRYGSRELKRA